MSYHEAAAIVSLVKDVSLTAGALTTIGLGIYGVRVWKRELVGKEIYIVVKDVIKNLHKVSRECNRLRSPVRANERRMTTAEEREHFTENEQWRQLELEVYRKRLDTISEVLDDLSDSLLNARVLIGSSVLASALPFQKKVRECIERVGDYTDLLVDENLGLGENSSPIIVAQQALYQADSFDDPLTNDVANTREFAEKALLRFLHRKTIRGDILIDAET